ncbi:MAG: hypothetical protein Q4D42_12090 [Eubacteriales bacterium]|nr:hypothetical protein [Eubacteriales bacterium]
MAKQGMKRPNRTQTHVKNEVPPVPELQGKAKTGKEKANPIISGTSSPSQKVFHTIPHKTEKPIAAAYSVIDTDLARDNLENDIPECDLP